MGCRGVQPTVAITHQQQGAAGGQLHFHSSMEAEEPGIELACLAPVGQPQPEGASLGGPGGTLVLTAPTKAALGAGLCRSLLLCISDSPALIHLLSGHTQKLKS
jgi:hypothetical protein